MPNRPRPVENPVHAATLADFLLARIGEDEHALDAMRDSTGAERAESDRWLSVRRAKAEHEAKRRIVDFVDAWFADAAANHEILRILAAVYANHPDYRPEWTPDA